MLIHCSSVVSQILTVSFLVFQHVDNSRILHLQPATFRAECMNANQQYAGRLTISVYVQPLRLTSPCTLHGTVK